MRALVVAAAVGVASCCVTGPAYAQPGPGGGALCSFTAVRDGYDGAHNGEIKAGPVTAGLGASISMKCTIQVGWYSWHTGGYSAAVIVQGATSSHVAVVEPTQVSFELYEDYPAYMCTEASVNGVIYYWDTSSNRWSPNGGVLRGDHLSSRGIS